MKIIKKPISITLYTDERVMKDGRFCKRLFVKALLLLISFASQMISYRLTKQLMNVNFNAVLPISPNRFQSYWLSYKEHRVDA